MEKKNNPFVGYEYKEVTVKSDQASLYMDCYGAFGWEPDENIVITSRNSLTTLRMKRDRKIVNKAELTRLQRHFEACAKELDELERSKMTMGRIWAMVIGVLGTAFMAGSVFAVTHQPPIYWVCILLAIPAFIGWIAPYFVFRRVVEMKTIKVQPIIEAKHDEIYEICEKGYSLL